MLFFGTCPACSVEWGISPHEGDSKALLAKGSRNSNAIIIFTSIANYLVFTPLVVLSSLILFSTVQNSSPQQGPRMRLELAIIVTMMAPSSFLCLSGWQALWNTDFYITTLHFCSVASRCGVRGVCHTIEVFGSLKMVTGAYGIRKRPGCISPPITMPFSCAKLQYT